MNRTNYLPEGPSFQPLASLTIAEWNPRLIREKRFQTLIKSIKDDPGFLVERPPLVADGPKHKAGGVVYAGNRRDQALGYLYEHGWMPPEEWQALGWLKGYTPVSVRDIPKRIAQKRAIQDNNHEGEWVEQDLAELLMELDSENVDLGLLGFDDKDLDALLELVGANGESDSGLTDPGAGELPEQAITKPGDIWVLGKHRLICCDSTDTAQLSRLMDGESGHLCVTSPPYWIGREYEQEHGSEEIDAHIESASKAIASVMGEQGHIALNTGTTVETKQGGDVRHVWLLLDKWDAAFAGTDWFMRNVRIWKKEGGFSSFAPQQDVVGQDWEFLASFTRRKPRAQNRIGEKWALDGVWDCQPQTANVGHSAPYPVEIPERYIALYTNPGDVVFDPYVGSGTTIVAAERQGRRCFAAEIDPKYCDVAVKRWQEMTGETAQRIGEAVAA